MWVRARHTSCVATTEPKKGEDSEAISLQEFLQSVPPHEARQISGMADPAQPGWTFATPDITLHCADADCGRPQNFTSVSPSLIRVGERNQDFVVHYRCK